MPAAEASQASGAGQSDSLRGMRPFSALEWRPVHHTLKAHEQWELQAQGLGERLMFDRILLASDGTYEGLVALREGAILAKGFEARVFLLIVESISTAAHVAGALHMVAPDQEAQALLERGMSRLSALGLRAEGAVARGEPVALISEQAKAWGAELVVLGHRRQSLLERWWSDAHGAYLVDHVGCSVLIARQVVSDDDFESRLKKTSAEGADRSSTR